MVRVTEETIRDVDVVLWVVDAAVPPTDEDRLIADLLQSIHRKKPIASLVLGLNKIDENREMSEAQRSERKELYQELLAWRTQADPSFETISFSALRGTGIDELLALLCSIAPPGPRYYSEDEVTDLQTRFIAAELIREKALHLLGEEVPHSLAVEVDEFSERSSQMTYISAVLYVERESQKAIVLGKGGRTIKKIGQAARPEIEELVGTRVYLELWVKVWERWRKREDMLRRLGYAIGKES
jgi:GTP-binding protein Era